MRHSMRVGLTFDDVILVPAKSEVLPSETSTQTNVTRNLTINIPIVSSAMDTVTEARLAIALAREGGVGVIHRVLVPADQAAEVDKVKKSESGMIIEPDHHLARSDDSGCATDHGQVPDLRCAGDQAGEAGRHSDEPRSAI